MDAPFPTTDPDKPGGEPTCGDRAGGTSAPRRRGRPPQLGGAEREALILDAMERALLAHGLEGTSMAAIAHEAGMSKRTLYAVFDSRAALFAACVRRIRASLVRPLSGADLHLPLPARLRLLLTPDPRDGALEMPTAVLRAVIAEAPRHPDLARSFLCEGPQEARRVIRAELDRAAARGEVRIADTAAAAALLCDMAYESPIDRLVSPDGDPRTAPQIEARIALAIRTFLHGISGRD